MIWESAKAARVAVEDPFVFVRAKSDDSVALLERGVLARLEKMDPPISCKLVLQKTCLFESLVQGVLQFSCESRVEIFTIVAT